MIRSKQHRWTKISLAILVIVILWLGLLVVSSSSYILAKFKYGFRFYFLNRQLLFASLGLVVMRIVTFIPYEQIRRYVKVIVLFCIGLLVLVLIPVIGMSRGGDQSWIG